MTTTDDVVLLARDRAAQLYAPGVAAAERRRTAEDQARAGARTPQDAELRARSARARVDQEIADERRAAAEAEAERKRAEAARIEAAREAGPTPASVRAVGGTDAEIADARRGMLARIEAVRAEIVAEHRERAEVERQALVDWRARHVAEAEAEHRAQLDAERGEAEAVPPADDASVAVDEDPAVAEIEGRIAAGDDSVTEAQLGKARAAAAVRSRFGRLREVAAERRRRTEADRAEAERVAVARAAVAEAVNGSQAAEIARAYDDAVSALARLTRTAQDRHRAIVRFAQGRGGHVLPAAERIRDRWPGANAVIVDGQEIRADESDPGQLVNAALAAAGVVVHTGGRGVDEAFRVRAGSGEVYDRQPPPIVTRGRASASGDGDGPLPAA